MKPDERAKSGKIGRIVVDLAVPASLQGAVLVTHIKERFGNKWLYFGEGEYKCRYIFIPKPTPSDIMEAFNAIWYTTFYLTIVVFSDDACIGMNINGTIKCANLDLKSADSSQTPFVLELMLRSFGVPKGYIDIYNTQFYAPAIIKSNTAFNNQYSRTFVEPINPTLQSGSTLTTLTHCYTYLVIAHYMSLQHTEFHNIPTAFENCGYQASLECCEIIEDLQFLKHSPVKNKKGEYVAILNPGVIYRASGTCRGDLPGKGDIEKRAIEFQHNLMTGLLSGIDNPTLNQLNPLVTTKTTISDEFKLTDHVNTFNFIDYSEVHKEEISDDDLFRRYRFTPNDLILIHHDCKCTYGETTYSSRVEKILSKDYGLSVPIV